MRNLFVCNTYMQLLVSLQIVLELKSADSNDLILTDHSIQMDVVAERLRKEGLFENVYYIPTKMELDSKGRANVYKYVLSLYGTGKRNFRQLLGENGVSNIEYDGIFAFNRNLFYWGMLICMIDEYRLPEINIIEEGILSYEVMIHHPLPKSIQLFKLSKSLKYFKNNFFKIDYFYCLFPEFVAEEKQEQCVRVPMFDAKNSSMVNLLQRIFDYKAQDLPQYIYFSGNADIDGYNIQEEDYVKKIADMVGKDNLVVKKHPRDKRSVYKELGLTEYEASHVPWEVTTLLEDFSNKVYITMFSTSILNSAAISGSDVKGYYLYPLIKEKNEKLYMYISEKLKIEAVLKRFKDKKVGTGFQVIETMDELEQNVLKEK